MEAGNVFHITHYLQNSGHGHIEGACVPMKRGWVGEAFPHMANGGGLYSVVLQGVEPSPGG